MTHQPNATSQPSRAASPDPLPDAWIDRIFAVMSGLYGSRFADLWSGSDDRIVRALWAEKLAGFASMPEAISAALRSLDSRPAPPNLPEFLALCRQEASRVQAMTPRLEAPALPRDAQAERAEAIAANFGKADDNRDYLDWARRPRSTLAMHAICTAAASDARLRRIIAELQAQGVCDANGSLLKRWSHQHGGFVPLQG